MNPDLFSRQLTWLDAQRFVDRQVLAHVPSESGFEQVCLEVLQVSESPAAPGTHQFTIAFQGPLNAFLAQGTYQLRHPDLGEFAVFMTPTAKQADGFAYEACFSHVV